MEKPRARSAPATSKRRFAKLARAELNRRGLTDMDIEIKLILRRQSAKRALRAKKNAKS